MIVIVLVKVLNVLCSCSREMDEYRIESDEWEEIQHLLGFFRPFAEVTVMMSSESHPTLSGIIVYFNIIMDHLDKYRKGKYHLSTPLPIIIKIAAQASYEKIKEFYNKTSKLHCIITLLDPRCNLEYFRCERFGDEWINPFMAR
jgi:hypothetical protein